MNPRELLERQINAAKDYLRRLHPRFTEERKQREEWIQEKEAELKELKKENRANSPQLEPCPFCGSFPTLDADCIRCDWAECYVRPSIYCDMPEMLPKLWNQMAMIESEDEKQERQNETIKASWPFKPCAKCGSPVEWEMSLSGRRGWVKCPRCGNEMTIDDEEHHTMEEWVEMWKQANTKPERRTELPSVNWLFNIPSEATQMLVIKLELLNSVLGLQRDEEGPVYVVNTIQDVLIEMIHTIEEGKNWIAGDEIQVLQIEIDKIKKDHVLELPKEQTIAVHGSHYVTNLHIARAVCREAELYAWDYEQKKGIEKMSQIPEYLNRLGDWLFVKAEYLRETEECC